MRIHNHKGAINILTHELKMKKIEITKLYRQNTSYSEENNRLGHNISQLTDKSNKQNKSDDEITINDNTGNTDNYATFTTVAYKKQSTAKKCEKPKKKSTKQPQSHRSTTAFTPVLTDNAISTKTKVANDGYRYNKLYQQQHLL